MLIAFVRLVSLRRHKVNDSSGVVLISFVGSREICHEQIAVSFQATCAKMKIEAQLLFRPEQCGRWDRYRRKNGPAIRKLVLGRPDVAFDKVIAELARFYGAYGKQLVACRMELNEPKRLEVWLNPVLVEKFGEIERARSQLNAARNNGGKAINFYSKFLRLLEADVVVGWHESSERLAVELQNFSRPFELS
jgi:hypothetical protein